MKRKTIVSLFICFIFGITVFSATGTIVASAEESFTIESVADKCEELTARE